MKTIMVIEDDENILDIFTIVLERAGYEVKTNNNAHHLLASKFAEPDLFIIDKQLSGVDGLDLCQHLKKREPGKNTPIIVCSASNDLRQYAREAGADGFLEKPFNIKALLQLVQMQINKPEV